MPDVYSRLGTLGTLGMCPADFIAGVFIAAPILLAVYILTKNDPHS